MSETDRDRIMKMIADGTLRPAEGARLLAQLSENETQEAAKAKAANKTKATAKDTAEKAEKPKKDTVNVKIPNADGTEREMEVPASLVPMIMKMVGVAVKEHVKTVGRETWAGTKVAARNKVDEVKDTLKTAIKGGIKKPKEDEKLSPAPEEGPQHEARRRILQMVQNGRISASDAGRLIQEVDALEAHGKKDDGDTASKH